MKAYKLGRNDPCPCNSGKKYKKCCGSASGQLPRRNIQNGPTGSGPARPPFTVRQLTPSEVPSEVIEKARKYFSERERQRQEHIARYGHVNPLITLDFQGYKLLAIGNQLVYKPSDKGKFLTDFLLDLVPHLFGREWFDREIAKPADQRHPVMQWRVKGMTFMNAQAPRPDGTYEVTPTGPLLAYLTFAYDLFVVQTNGRLDDQLLERLKHPEQFQGARHELFAEATCLRAGFAIEHEDETDPSSRHAEFTATHKATGVKLSVEAKSKHRPGVLGQPGTREPSNALNLRFGKLLNDAVAKKPPHPLVVFMDLNMPFETANRLLTPQPAQPLHPLILRTLNRMRAEHGGKDPISMVVFTNHPQHYTKDDEMAGKPHLLSQISLLPTRPVRQDVLWTLHQAANLYGNIPQELPANGPATN
ncbi:MAG: SEC-C domain-containing protein [Acidobacteriales bacterium]|nr:SEC-C domain-containing protein [Terriglobales bacterium]